MVSGTLTLRPAASVNRAEAAGVAATANAAAASIRRPACGTCRRSGIGHPSQPVISVAHYSCDVPAGKEARGMYGDRTAFGPLTHRDLVTPAGAGIQGNGCPDRGRFGKSRSCALERYRESRRPDMRNLMINGERLWASLMELARIGATEKGGVRRLAASDLD